MSKVPFSKGITVPKSLVLDVCEPYINEETVYCGATGDTNFSMYRMGFVRIEEKEYAFGTESTQYLSKMRCRRSKDIPIIIAENTGNRFQLAPIKEFSEKTLSEIVEMIKSSLYAVQVAAKYAPSHC